MKNRIDTKINQSIQTNLILTHKSCQTPAFPSNRPLFLVAGVFLYLRHPDHKRSNCFFCLPRIRTWKEYKIIVGDSEMAAGGQ